VPTSGSAVCSNGNRTTGICISHPHTHAVTRTDTQTHTHTHTARLLWLQLASWLLEQFVTSSLCHSSHEGSGSSVWSERPETCNGAAGPLVCSHRLKRALWRLLFFSPVAVCSNAKHFLCIFEQHPLKTANVGKPSDIYIYIYIYIYTHTTKYKHIAPVWNLSAGGSKKPATTRKEMSVGRGACTFMTH